VVIIHAVKRIIKRVLSRRSGEEGISLIETLIGLGILASIGVGFMQGISTVSMTIAIHEERVTASALAQAQIEAIRASDYVSDGSYDISVTPPAEYSIVIDVTNLEIDKQQVTVEVLRNGEFVLEITTYKMDRW